MPPCPGRSESELIVICIPIYNDWTCALALLKELDAALRGGPWSIGVLFVNDGSADPPPAAWPEPSRTFRWVRVLPLRRNLGHQRAIAIGISYIQSKTRCRAVVVMDGDGEDAPSDVLRLLNRCDELADTHIVFARRSSQRGLRLSTVLSVVQASAPVAHRSYRRGREF